MRARLNEKQARRDQRDVPRWLFGAGLVLAAVSTPLNFALWLLCDSMFFDCFHFEPGGSLLPLVAPANVILFYILYFPIGFLLRRTCLLLRCSAFVLFTVLYLAVSIGLTIAFFAQVARTGVWL